MIRVLEKIGRGLVDGNGPRAGGRIGGLAGVDGKSGKLALLGFGHDRSFRFEVGRPGKAASTGRIQA
jgi:hypothetical protein